MSIARDTAVVSNAIPIVSLETVETSGPDESFVIADGAGAHVFSPGTLDLREMEYGDELFLPTKGVEAQEEKNQRYVCTLVVTHGGLAYVKERQMKRKADRRDKYPAKIPTDKGIVNKTLNSEF